MTMRSSTWRLPAKTYVIDLRHRESNQLFGSYLVFCEHLSYSLGHFSAFTGLLGSDSSWVHGKAKRPAQQALRGSFYF